MQREHLRRGFTISHQKVVLEIDFSGKLWGYTEITIVPNSKDLRTINLHSRQCAIHNVTVASHRADFIQCDALANLNISSPQDVHTHPELKRKLYSALAEDDEGELSIAIPKDVSVKSSGGGNGSFFANEASTPEPQTPGFSGPQSSIAAEFSPITVNIEYSIRDPVDGLQFVLPTDTYPYRVPHVYTTPSTPDAARCWVPCIDNIWEKCTWDLEFVVPRYLEDHDGDPEASGEADEPKNEKPTVVVCSGEFVEQVTHPFNSNKSIFIFSQGIQTSAQHIGFVAGPLHVLPIPTEHTTGDEPAGSSQPQIHAFCLPGHETQLSNSVPFLRQAMTFFASEFGSYPFGSYKLVFVDEMPRVKFDTSTLSIASADLLHGDDAIDQVYETRQTLTHSLAYQWIGINIQPKAWADLWLTNGLGLYISGLFLRKLFGTNEYRFRMKKDMSRVTELDNGGMPPICQPQHLDPPEAATLPFLNLKSPLVLHILDRRLGKSGTSLGLSRVLPKLFLSAISGEMQNNALSTHTFLRTCRKVSGVDLRSFAEQWIYGSGCPSFGFSASFNRKKMAVEITMRQDAPAYKELEHNPVVKALLKPVPFFEGQMTIRIHEADGTPYEHVLDIRAPFKRYEVPFNTKYKRVRRNTKRYLARQAAAQAAAEGDAEAAEAMGMVDMGFGLDIWENERERENWKVADWSEDDEQVMSGATYEWIRMDADFEWIAAVAFDQPDYMWVSQLQRDRDVVAQLEAVNALSKMPSSIVSSQLTKTVLVSNYFFRVRCEAALALVTCAIRRLDFLGLFHLFKLFLRYCYDPEDPQQDLFTHTYVPRPNDFSDFADYFVRRALIKAISQVRFENGKCPSVVRKFLTDQLKYNDNTANPYTDAFYICTLISSLACACVSTSPPERGELFPMEAKNEQSSEDAMILKDALAEADRYRNMDRLIASPHNVVTIAALEFRLILSVANLIPNDPRVFFPLTREGNYVQVRIAAFDALFLTRWYTPKIVRYILAVIANDPSRIIRRHVARNASQSLALLVTMGELKDSKKESESLLIEEDGATQEKVKENKRSEVDQLVKALRKDKEVGKNEVLREFLLPIILAPDADHEVRWSILKLLDILVRGSEEVPPKFTIYLPPSTPITETPPSLPSVKIPALKPGRPLKSAGISARSPLVPPTNPPKVRLLPGTASADASSHKVPSTPHAETSLSINTKKNVTIQTPHTNGGPSIAPPRPKGRPPKPKDGKVVPKAQSGGMDIRDVKACEMALKKLKGNKHARFYLHPVDPVRDKAINYFEIIKNPIDLDTMGIKLSQGMYKDRFAFEADFRLMIRNAKTYNSPETYVYNEGVALEQFFDAQWARINHTIESKKPNEPPPPPPRPMQPPPVPLHKVSTAHMSQPKPAPVAPQSSTSTVSETTSRPSIKLKIGTSSSSLRPDPIPTAASQPVKLKPRKSKAAEAASGSSQPPVDDGTDDLLEEVIAIERDVQKKKHQYGPSERPEPSITGPPAKRKKVSATVDLVEEDEILALASPHKRPRSPDEKKEIPILEQPAAPIKHKRPFEPHTSAHASPVPAVPPSRATSKPTASATPPPPPPPAVKALKKTSTPVVTVTPFDKKKCQVVLKALAQMPEYGIFSRPVDPELDGCPTYFDEIKNPMDFGTMGTKVKEGRYTTMEEFDKDAKLVFGNCKTFNPPTTAPHSWAEVVEKVYRREWAKAMEKKLAPSDKRALLSLVNNLVKDPISWVFQEPVDPIALGVPQYYDVIPKHTARDLRTIRQKLEADKYESIQAWEEDVDLMIQNAIRFNGEDSEVGMMAITVRNWVKDRMAPLKSKKRKESDKPNGSQPSAAKKARVG